MYYNNNYNQKIIKLIFISDLSDKNIEDWVDERSVAVISHGWHDSGITKWINVTRDVLLLNTNDSDWAVLVIDWTLEASSLVFYLLNFYSFHTLKFGCGIYNVLEFLIVKTIYKIV